MADTHETIADIIAEMRGMGNYQRYSGDHARVLANRLEAAHKRELSKNASKNEANFGQLSDCAKLRESVKCLMDNLNIHLMQPSETITVNRAELDGMVMVCAKVLSAPPRNCDKYSHDEALQVWASEKENEHNGCFDEWLYEIAKEGGAK